ncbi:MAG TPA: hypothetical protein VGE52_07355 [Pirellulales bacterium]
MAIFSGKDGAVQIGSNIVGHVVAWRFTPRSRNPSWTSNATNGHKARLVGAKEGVGSFECKLDSTGHAAVAEGDFVTLNLHVDATGENYMSIPAVIDEAPLSVDVNAGAIVGYTAKFSTRGAWTRHGILAVS